MTVLTRECCFSDFSIAIDDARGIGLSENRPLRRADGKLWMCSSFCFVFGVDGGGAGWGSTIRATMFRSLYAWLLIRNHF